MSDGLLCPTMIVEDVSVWAEAIKTKLESENDEIKVKYTASSSTEARRFLEKDDTLRLVFVDISLESWETYDETQPDDTVVSGPNLVRLIRHCYPNVGVVAITQDLDLSRTYSMFLASPHAFLHKQDIDKRSLRIATNTARRAAGRKEKNGARKRAVKKQICIEEISEKPEFISETVQKIVKNRLALDEKLKTLRTGRRLMVLIQSIAKCNTTAAELQGCCEEEDISVSLRTINMDIRKLRKFVKEIDGKADSITNPTELMAWAIRHGYAQC